MYRRKNSSPLSSGSAPFSGHAPVRGVPSCRQPWQGAAEVKPWNHPVTAVIPCLDTPDELALVVRLLLCQTVPVFVQIIDTGSTDENLTKVLGLRSDRVEVHSLRFVGVKHPSDFPAIAMDLAFSACQTEWMFATHADCFLKRQDVIEEFIKEATQTPYQVVFGGHDCSVCRGLGWNREAIGLRGSLAKGYGHTYVCYEHRDDPLPAVGYRISPRSHDNWDTMVSHTATLFHMPSMLAIGAGWCQRRVCLWRGIKDHRPDPDRANWPDTEILVNEVMWRHGMAARLIDQEAPVEENFHRNEDHRIDHCRTLTAGKLYSPAHYAKAREWAEDARQKAQERLALWES